MLVTTDLVKWFNADKGFGFSENEKVSFDVTSGPKGPRATNVRRIS